MAYNFKVGFNKGRFSKNFILIIMKNNELKIIAITQLVTLVIGLIICVLGVTIYILNNKYSMIWIPLIIGLAIAFVVMPIAWEEYKQSLTEDNNTEI